MKSDDWFLKQSSQLHRIDEVLLKPTPKGIVTQSDCHKDQYVERGASMLLDYEIEHKKADLVGFGT